MKLRWIGILLVVLTGALMLASQPATNLPQGQDASASPDVWGGRDISMEVTPQGATLEFDCAHGNVLEPIEANAKGEFTARGTYTPEHGGPIRSAIFPPPIKVPLKATPCGSKCYLSTRTSSQNLSPSRAVSRGA